MFWIFFLLLFAIVLHVKSKPRIYFFYVGIFGFFFRKSNPTANSFSTFFQSNFFKYSPRNCIILSSSFPTPKNRLHILQSYMLEFSTLYQTLHRWEALFFFLFLFSNHINLQREASFSDNLDFYRFALSSFLFFPLLPKNFHFLIFIFQFPF